MIITGSILLFELVCSTYFRFIKRPLYVNSSHCSSLSSKKDQTTGNAQMMSFMKNVTYPITNNP